MSCTCQTIKELSCWLGINLWNDCEKTICKMNSILRRHYSHLINSKITRKIALFSWNWDINLQTENWEDIYKVLWIYVFLEWCEIPKCYEKVDVCECECDNLYKMRAKRWFNADNLSEWEFYYCGNDLSFVVTENAEWWFVEYSKWPVELESINDKVCLDPIEIELFQLWMLRWEAEVGKDYELARYFEQQMYNTKTRIQNEIEDVIPYSIWGLWKNFK